MIKDHHREMDLSFLQVLEREMVLEVLRRDKQLRTIEEDRIRLVISDCLYAEDKKKPFSDAERRQNWLL